MLKLEVIGQKELSDALRKLGNDLPGVLASGLNRTMRAVEQAELNSMERSIDRPTAFTLNALHIQAANAKHLDASISIRPIQADYLRYSIEGGIVEKTVVPFKIRRDASGNIPGKKRGWAGMARGKSDFVSKITKGRGKGKVGLWRKQGESVFLLALRDRQARRAKRWPYYETAERVAQKRLESDVMSAIDGAMRGR
jgi:hypothetical protein